MIIYNPGLRTLLKPLNKVIRWNQTFESWNFYNLFRRLTQADADLRHTDLQIRSEMAAQKFELETKINQDIANTDSALRLRYDNEIFRIDNKFTNSINGKPTEYR